MLGGFLGWVLDCGLRVLRLGLNMMSLCFISVSTAHPYPAAKLPQQKGAKVGGGGVIKI